MPISASAKKSLRVAERRALENKATKLRIRNQVKKTTLETLGQSFSILDKAAKNHVIHPNKAARLKSRLAKKLAAA
jgi:small subunit ribosomal protein S20